MSRVRTSVNPSVNYPSADSADGTDGGVVGIAPSGPPAPALNTRSYANDPDGDIVHPHPLRPGELQEGTTIRVHLLEPALHRPDRKRRALPHPRSHRRHAGRPGRSFPPALRSTARVVEVSTGHAGGRGAMRLQPEAIILPNGSRYRLHAALTGTPGSRSHVVGRRHHQRPTPAPSATALNTAAPSAAGVVTGAIVAGPVGALTGGLIGAGAITVHLLVSHPQATLETGTTLIFQLTDRLYLAPEATHGN